MFNQRFLYAFAPLREIGSSFRRRFAQRRRRSNSCCGPGHAYLVKHALDKDPGVKEIQTHKTRLDEFFALINQGEFQTNIKDYAAAVRSYTEALKLRPDSKLAQAGLKKAQSQHGRTY